MVSELSYYYRACRSFHDERTYALYLEYTRNNALFEEDDAEVCNLFEKRQFGLSNDDMREVRRRSIDVERVNKILGEMPN